MENEIRLVLLVIGALIILAIFWDGMRRQRKQRQQTKDSLTSEAKEKSSQILTETLQLDTSTERQVDTTKSLASSDIAAATQEQPFTKHGFDLPVNEKTEDLANKPVTVEDLPTEEPVVDKIEAAASVIEEAETIIPASESPVDPVTEESEQVMEQAKPKPVIEPIQEKVEQQIVEEDKELANATDDSLVVEEPTLEPVAEPAIEPAPSKPKPTKVTNRLVIFTLIAPGEKTFGGFHLLQALLNNGFRFGEDKIFHYREDNEPQGKKLFSLAAATKTGLFNLSNMASFSCKGLVLFMNSQDHLPQSNYVFEQMVEVAEALAESLHAELRIAQTEAWEEQTLAQLHAELVELDSHN